MNYGTGFQPGSSHIACTALCRSLITIEEIPDEDASQSLNSLGLDEFKGLLFVPTDPQELGSFMKDLVAEQQHFLDGLQKDYPGLSKDLYTDKGSISWNTSSLTSWIKVSLTMMSFPIWTQKDLTKKRHTCMITAGKHINH